MKNLLAFFRAESELAIGPGGLAAVEMGACRSLESIVAIFSHLPSECAMRRARPERTGGRHN
jgi:hypothetical protein